MGTSLPRRLNLLWVLAALLGIAAIHGTFRAIHHPEPSREIMGHFAGVTAGYATSIAEGRLQALGREAFAPVTPWRRRIQFAADLPLPQSLQLPKGPMPKTGRIPKAPRPKFR